MGDAKSEPPAPVGPSSTAEERRLHQLPVRIMHWINALAMAIMITSGWGIYDDDVIIRGFHFSRFWRLGDWAAWSLDWHFAGMWFLAINGLIYLVYGFTSGRFRERLLPIRPRDVIQTVIETLHFKIAHDDITVYNAVQKLLYIVVILAGVSQVITGLAIWKPVQFSGLVSLLGGFETARVLHFAGMAVIVGFVIVHVALALLVPKGKDGMTAPTRAAASHCESAARDRRSDCAIGVMAKTPRAGYSKTRLCPPLRPEQAASLSAAFLRDTTEAVRTAATSAPIAGYAAYAPAGTDRALTPHLAPGTTPLLADGSLPAPAGVPGFGRCLFHAVRALFDRGHAAVCVLSADAPTLPAAILVTAAISLLTGGARRAVIGACDDGGYYLLGMRRPHAGLFADIDWSTDAVAAQTRARAAALRLDLVELPVWYDIDDAASLDRLVRETTGDTAAPWTVNAIAKLGASTVFRSVTARFG